ncbi:5449_t:CDS:2, partial [Gigaspora rosea]
NMELPLVDLTNILSQDGQISSISYKFFTSGWAQKENQKSSQRNEFAKIAPHVKLLLETIFVAGAVNRKKNECSANVPRTTRTIK